MTTALPLPFRPGLRLGTVVIAVALAGPVCAAPACRATSGAELVPLVELFDPGVYREERWDIFGTQRSMFFFELVGDTVWGATAAMLLILDRTLRDT
mgnify:CR=1 FL=1